jgi:hypothetical protein
MIIGRTFHLYFETNGWILGSTKCSDRIVVYSPCPKDDTAFSFHFFMYAIYGDIFVSLSNTTASSAVTDTSQTKVHHCTVSYGILHIICIRCTVHKNCVMEGNVKTVTVYSNVLPLYCICPTYRFLHVLFWTWIWGCIYMLSVAF